MPTISKSRYLDGLKCHKLLWYSFNRKEEFPEPDAATQAVFDQGHLVGEYAKKLFPDGIEVGKGTIDFARVLPESRKAAELRKPLFEAAFEFDGAFARADILDPAPRGTWDLIEVKSTNEVKDQHLADLALQKYVYDGAGITIRKCYLMHLNRDYVRRGEVEPARLFVKEDMTGEVKKLVPDIPPTLRTMAAVIRRRQAPDTPIGPYCSDPYECPLMDLCWKFLPKHSVFDLYGGGKKAFDLLALGVLKLRDIPEDTRLTPRQHIQVEAVRTRKPQIDAEAIREFLSSLKYPIYFLDFETFSSAVPLVDNARPHQQVPFQFSLHVLSSLTGKPVHHAYLADGPTDARPEILRRLKSLLSASGSILTFNSAFEIRMLKEMARDVPEYGSWCEKIVPRIADLIVPFRSFSYYHPEQQGEASLKSVLPALTGRSYEGMPIADGGTASLEFLRVTFGQASDKDRREVRRNLEAYCGLDTEGMIDIVRELNRLVQT